MPTLVGLEQHDTLPGIPSPAETPRVLGHGEAVAQFRQAWQSDRLHHAWLMQGPRGSGKATLAFAFARELLAAQGGDAAAADLARQVASGSHPNLVHIVRPPADRGGFRTQITVDEVRKLNRFFQTTSGSRQWRVAIVDPVDDMNRNAANALLKMLEEPPARCLFLIVNHLPGRLLPTIRSRCRVIRLEPLCLDVAVDVLESLEIGVTRDELRAAAQRSNGSVRDAIQLLSSGGLETEKRLDSLLGTREPEWHGIQALADELTQKDRETAFELAVSSLFSRLAAESERASAAGDLPRAESLAALWQNEAERFREGLLYNLDRRQLLLTHFAKRFAADRSPEAH
ncbi:DNA polymerase III subunit delta' [Aureimonas leprariae]|nr:DNA polymerase III subunit delta' [Aureimonas leprariae]